jgi:hypothetical protein
MNTIKKILLLIIAVSSFTATAYNLVWTPDWQIERWPETRLRAAYLQAALSAAIDLPGAKNHQILLDAIRARDPEIENTVFNRLLVSLSLTIVLTTAASVLPGFLGRGKEGRIRGAELASANRLRRLIWQRRHQKEIILATGYSLLFSLISAILFKTLIAGCAGLVLGVVIYLIVERTRKPDPQLKPITIGNIEIPPDVEGRHFLVSGTPGSGKSMLIYRVIQCARRRGDRGFVMDIGGACHRRFARNGDLILAPGEPGSVKWNPFAEIRSRFDFMEIARAAIPDGNGDAQGWHEMARTLLAVVMEKMHGEGDWSVTRLLYVICSSKREEVSEAVAGTPADVYAQDGAERLLQSVRSVLTTYLVAWHFIEDGGDFSIRDWIRNAPADGWLFAKYSDGNATVMRQLLASWLKIAITETIGDDNNPPPRTWFIADEFDSLGAVSAARDALSKMRRYNGRCLFGMQTVAQLWSTYGRDNAQVLLSCLSNQIYLRTGDPETGEYCSRALGDQEFLRQERSRSRRGLLGLGGDPSKSEAERHAMERIVLPSELMTLPDLVGYLKLAGDLPMAKINIPVPSTEKRI